METKRWKHESTQERLKRDGDTAQPDAYPCSTVYEITVCDTFFPLKGDTVGFLYYEVVLSSIRPNAKFRDTWRGVLSVSQQPPYEKWFLPIPDVPHIRTAPVAIATAQLPLGLRVGIAKELATAAVDSLVSDLWSTIDIRGPVNEDLVTAYAGARRLATLLPDGYYHEIMPILQKLTEILQGLDWLSAGTAEMFVALYELFEKQERDHVIHEVDQQCREAAVRLNCLMRRKEYHPTIEENSDVTDRLTRLSEACMDIRHLQESVHATMSSQPPFIQPTVATEQEGRRMVRSAVQTT